MSDIKALEERVARLEATAAINTILGLYGQAVDWLDSSLLDRVIFDDADCDYGMFHVSGREAKKTLLDQAKTLPRKWHFTAPAQISFEGDAAADTSSFMIVVNSMTAEPGDKLNMFFGWFLDRLERREGQWGIVKRKHVLLGFSSIAEQALPDWLSALNRISNATTEHSDYMRFSV